ncbi:S-layer homology domain-containing protein [Candidatus Gracilibacteria bacterium]|nr:S-layer homology domain-containing protein [Candidatus Gracilibacteria bacterium]
MGKFRKAIASLSLVAILSSFVVSTSVASAGSFSDVSASAYYYGAVEALVAADVVDGAKDTYNPGLGLNRAEAAKFVVAAAGLTGTTPSVATFTDVPKSHWAFEVIEIANQNGVMEGYSHKPGYTGPGDTVTRQEFAKMLVAGFDLPTYTPSAPTFPDVPTTAWSYSFVETAKFYGVLGGNPDGTFAPNTTIVRADGAVMTAQAMDAEPSDTDTDPDTDPDTDTDPDPVVIEPAGDGDITIEISDSTPSKATIPSQAISVPFATWDITAGDEDAEIDSIVITRVGVSKTTDFSALYLYDADDNRLTSSKVVNSDTNQATFSTLKFKVAAGKTASLTLKIDMADVTAAGEGQFAIASASDVDANGGTVVVETSGYGEGSYSDAAAGMKMDLSTIDAGSVVIAKNGTITDPKVGEKGVKIGEFKVTPSTEDALLTQMNLTVKGTLNADLLDNFELKDNGGTVIATGSEVTSKDLVVLTFAEPYQIDDGTGKTFKLYADVNGGDVGDTIRVYLDEDTDILSIGGDYGFGMSVTRTTFDGDSCTTSSGDCSFSTLEGGDVTFVFNGPVAGEVSIGGDNLTIFEFSLSAIGLTTVKDLDIIVYGDDDADNDAFDAVEAGNDTDTDGLIIAAPEAAIKDIKIINVDTGKTIMGPLELDSAAVGGDDAEQTIDFTDDFDIPAGTTLNLAVVVDIDSDAGANTYYGATLDISGFVAEDANGDNVATTAIIPSSDLQGNGMKAVAPSLTTTLSSTPVSDTFVKGTNLVPMVGINWKAGDSEAITLTDLTLRGELDINGDGYDDQASLKDYVGAVYLYHDGVKISGPESLDSAGDVAFTGINWEIAKSTTEKMVVMADLAKLSSVTAELIAFGIDATSDVTAQDEDGDSVTSGLAPINQSQTVVVTMNDSGTLALTEEGSPSAGILVGGTTDVLVAKYKFNAVDEAFIVNDLELFTDTNTTSTDAESTYQRVVSVLKVKYTNSAGTEVTKTGNFSAGQFTFNDMDMLVEKDKSAYVQILVDANTIQGGAVSGDLLRVVINENTTTNDFEAVGQGSGVTLTESSSSFTLPTNEANVKIQYLRETQPVVSVATGLTTTFANGENTLYGLKVVADSKEAVSLKTIKFKLTYGRDGAASGGLGNFKFFRDTTDLTDDVDITSFGDSTVLDNEDLEATSTDGLPGSADNGAVAYDGNAVVTFNDSASAEEVIPAGATKTYYLKATANAVDATGDTVSVYVADDTYTITNGTASAHEFDVSRLKYIDATTGTSSDVAAEAIVYDLDDDSTASDGNTCSNSTDDITLGGTATDCGAIAAATIGDFKWLDSTTGVSADTAVEGIVYDANGDSALADGAVCTNASENITLFGTVSDCGTIVAITATDLFLGVDAGSADYVGYDGNADTVNGASGDAVCTLLTDNEDLGGTAPALCETVSKTGGSTHSFIWSDNSNTSHSTATTDWVNGFLVDNLSTTTHTLSF